MADNVAITAGSGTDIATDDVAGVHYQKIKIAHGAADSATLVTTGTAAFPIQGADAEDAAATAYPVLTAGRYDSTPRALETGDVGAIAVNDAGHLIVDLGSNNDVTVTSGTITANAGTGTFTVSGTVTANAGTGTLAVSNAALSVTGGGTEASAMRVTIASDSTGVLSIDDNGSSITVDNGGTFAVQATVAAGATNIAKAEDVASADADVGVPAMAVRKATPANTSDTDGDYEFLQMSAGRLWTSATIDAALPAGTNAIGKLAANSGVDIGDVDVTSISAGSNLIGDVGISGARTSGGTTIFRSLDLDETEEEIKASAGQVYWIHAMNLSATKKYLKFYNATAANVTVGTTTPVLTFPLLTSGDTNGAGFTFAVPNGIVFGTAITVAATTGVADNDTGAPGANEVVVNIGYA
jgi:hypothetical protein